MTCDFTAAAPHCVELEPPPSAPTCHYETCCFSLLVKDESCLGFQEEVETENRRNTRTKLAPKLSPQTEESATSQVGLRGRKDGTLQKIGDFLQRSPTVLGSGAKKMMSLVSSRVDAQAASSSSSSCSPLRLTAKRSRKKLYRPEISCPMEMPPHPIINQETKDGDGGQQIKLRLRSRVAKC
ncbi:kinesin-like protein KIF20B [Poecilia reticulata]|uniref:kinesin-like protein KIF20B n=1 Tax=Poecilia reticulata TaxID=8081 RepID=UPI0004A26393|nr:PREDICTED: kinesin-like protein KIF20B [Poecilia reticulata]